LVCGWVRQPRSSETWFDALWISYIVAYLFGHTAIQFSVWDRYLLPLAPLVALLLARIVVLIGERCIRSGGFPSQGAPALWRCPMINPLRAVLLALFLVLSLFSGLKAARNGYPIGGEHWAYQGLDEIAAYLRENAPPDAVLYHRWLRWHYSYYLHGTEFELRWWESGEHMQREALRTPDRVQYVVLPDWRTLEPDAPGLDFKLLYQARRRDNTVSLSLYRVYPRALAGLLEGAL
jgi:hypothetical protein